MANIYNYEKRLKSIEINIQQSKKISQKNKKLILEFRDDCFANNIGLARIIRYLYCLRDISIWLNKSFSVAKTQDIKQLVAKIERMNNYSPRTKYEYRATLKKFYKWLKNTDNPEEISWIKLNFKKNNEKLPSDLLTEKDITEMVNKTSNPRDRAIIITLYESGCRIGEFIKLQIRDITFDKYGSLLNVTGKTGARRVRVVTASPYLLDLINKHPNKENPESYLWLKNNTSKMLEYAAFCKALRVAAKRANIKKKVNPHNFRHARATSLANKLTDQQLKIFFGWTRSSDMASVYVHLSGRDVDDALLSTYGIKTDRVEEKTQKLKPISCQRCSLSNEPTNKYCKQCGFPLNKESQQEILQKELENKDIDSVMNNLLNDPEILRILRKKLENAIPKDI